MSRRTVYTCTTCGHRSAGDIRTAARGAIEHQVTLHDRLLRWRDHTTCTVELDPRPRQLGLLEEQQ